MTDSTHAKVFVEQGTGVDDDAKLRRTGGPQGVDDAVPDGEDGNDLVLEGRVVPATLHRQPATLKQHVCTHSNIEIRLID